MRQLFEAMLIIIRTRSQHVIGTNVCVNSFFFNCPSLYSKFNLSVYVACLFLSSILKEDIELSISEDYDFQHPSPFQAGLRRPTLRSANRCPLRAAHDAIMTLSTAGRPAFLGSWAKAAVLCGFTPCNIHALNLISGGLVASGLIVRLAWRRVKRDRFTTRHSSRALSINPHALPGSTNLHTARLLRPDLALTDST